MPPDPITELADQIAQDRPRRDYEADLRQAIDRGDPDEITEAAREFVDWRIRRREVGL